MAVHLARSSSVREMSTEDFQRQMFQKRNLFSLGTVSLELNNREETKSKSNTTARKSTHVLKTPPSKLPPQKNHAQTNTLVNCHENNVNVTGSFASVLSNDSSSLHNRSRTFNGTDGISDRSNTSSPTHPQLITSFVGKKRGRKRKDASRRQLKEQNPESVCVVSKIDDDPVTPAKADINCIQDNSVDNTLSDSAANTWNLSLKQTIQEVKGVLGLMLKMKRVQSSDSFHNLSDNVLTQTLKNSCIQSSGKVTSPDNGTRFVHEVLEPCIDRTKSHSSHLLEDSRLQSLHIDCNLAQTSNSLPSRNGNEIFTSDLPCSSVELLDGDLLPEEEASCMLTSPSTIDSPAVTVTSHITSEEAESEEPLQLWLDDSSGDGVNLNTSASERQDTKIMTPAKLFRAATKAVPKHLAETTPDDVPLLLSVYSETSPLEQPRSPEMPVLKPVTQSPTTELNLLHKGASQCSRSKLPQVLLERLSPDLVNKLNSGPVSSSSVEVSRLLISLPPKLTKKPEPRRNLFTIFTSRMSKLHSVPAEKTEAAPPFCTDLLIIDGIEFYSFETLQALNEYTEHELRKKQELQALNCYDVPEETSEFNDEDFKDITDSAKYSCACIKPIIPTKTDDITKIKGWRNKLFAAETTQTVSNNLPDPEDIKKYHWTKRIELCKHLSHSERKRAGLLNLVKRRRLRLTANKFTKKKIHMKQLKGPLTEGIRSGTTETFDNEDELAEKICVSYQKAVQESSAINSRTTAPELNFSNHKQNSVFESELLEEFLKSRSKLNARLDSGVTDIQVSKKEESPVRQRLEDKDEKQKVLPVPTNPKLTRLKGSIANQACNSVANLKTRTTAAISQKKRGRPKTVRDGTEMYRHKIDGTPFKTPYGLFQYFGTVFLPVGSSQDDKPSFNLPYPATQNVIEPPHIVTADVAKNAVTAVPEQFSLVNKLKKNEEKISLQQDVNLVRKAGSTTAYLDGAVAASYYQIPVNKERLAASGGVIVSENLTSAHSVQASSVALPSVEPKCKESFCRFGCVCESLKVRKRKRGHCGKAACMFTCFCSNADDVDGGQADLPASSVIRTEIMTDDGPVKRRRATRLPAKLMDSAFVWHQGKELLIDPDLSPSLRAVGRKSKMLIKAKVKTSPEKPKITNRIRYDYSVGTNRPIAPKIPPIRITNIKAKTSYPVITSAPPIPSTIIPKPRTFSHVGKVQSASQPMLPLGPSCVNGNMIVDPVIHGYLARALICIAHSPGGGSCLKFIGVTAVPQSKEQRDAVVMQLCNSKENSVAFTRIGQSAQVVSEKNKMGAAESPPTSHANQTSNMSNSVTCDEPQFSKTPSYVKLYVDGGSVVCPPDGPQVLFPQVLNTVSICRKNFMVTGYLVSKCNLKEAAVRANTTGAVVSVPIRIVRGQFVPFSQSNSIADLAKPVFGAYAIQNLTSHVFVGPFNLTIHSKHKPILVQTSSAQQEQSTINSVPSIRGLIPVKRGACFTSSIPSERGNITGASSLQFGLNQQVGATTTYLSHTAPDQKQVRWNVTSEDIECVVSDLLAEVCAGEQEPNCATNLTRVVICGSSIRTASINTDIFSGEVSNNSLQHVLAPEYVSEYKKSNVPATMDENARNSISHYESLCKPVKVVIKKLEHPSPTVPQHKATIPGDMMETLMDPARSAETPRLLHPDVTRLAWKKCLQEKSRRLDDGRELSRMTSRCKQERSRRREQCRNLRRLALVLDPTNSKVLQKASKYPSLISLLSQAKLSIRELESHCRNIEEFKKVLINRRLHLFTQYTRLLKELPDAVQKEAVQKLTIRLQACCQVRDKRSRVQTTWEPELDKKHEDFSSENGNACSDDHTTTGSESASSSSSSDSDESSYLDVETVSDVDESSMERTIHNSNQTLHSLQDLSNSTSPLPHCGINSQDHINRLPYLKPHTTIKVQHLNSTTNPIVDIGQSVARVQESLVSKNLPNATDAAYYSALSNILCDHANYTVKVLPDAPFVESSGLVHQSDDNFIQESYLEQPTKNNIEDSGQVSSSGCVENLHDGVVCLADNRLSTNTMYNTFDLADQSAMNGSLQTIQENGEILEITISDEDIGALNSGLDLTQNSVQYGMYPTSLADDCSSQVNSVVDSSIAEATHCASDNVHQDNYVYLPSPVMLAEDNAYNAERKMCGDVTDDIKKYVSEVASPLEEIFPENMSEDLPKIIACSSITEAEFFAEGNS